MGASYETEFLVTSFSAQLAFGEVPQEERCARVGVLNEVLVSVAIWPCGA